MNTVNSCAQFKDSTDCVKILQNWLKGDATAAKFLSSVPEAPKNLNEIIEMDDIRPNRSIKRKSSLELNQSDMMSIKQKIATEEKKGIEASVELYRDLMTTNTK